MKKIIAFYCFYLLSASIIGQTSNPFDIFRDTLAVEEGLSLDSTDDTTVTSLPVLTEASDSAVLETSSPDASIATPSDDAHTINPLVNDLSSPIEADIIDLASTREGNSVDTLIPDPLELENVPLLGNQAENPFEVESTREDIEQKPIFRPLEKIFDKKTEVAQTNENFLFWFLLLALLLTAFGITRDRKSFGNLYKLITNNNYLKLVNRDLNGGKMLFYAILYAVFFITLSIYIYQYASKKQGFSGFSFFLQVLGIVLLIYLVRHTAMYLASKFIITTQLLSDFNFLIVISNILCGLFLFPIVLLISYSPLDTIFLTFGLMVIGLCYCLRQGNGVLTALKEKQANLFHFFIYICTFEIAPALIIITLVQSYSGAM